MNGEEIKDKYKEIMIQEVKLTPEQFVYWLQGFMEIAKPESLTKEQTQEIKNHLAEVFIKVTPPYTVTTWPENGTFTSDTLYCDSLKKGVFIC